MAQQSISSVLADLASRSARASADAVEVWARAYGAMVKEGTEVYAKAIDDKAAKDLAVAYGSWLRQTSGNSSADLKKVIEGGADLIDRIWERGGAGKKPRKRPPNKKATATASSRRAK